MYLALDLGTTTGWALSDFSGDSILSGHRQLTTPKARVDRYPNFLILLNELYVRSGKEITKIYYEKNIMSYQNVYANYVYGGFLAVLEVWSTDNRSIPLVGITCSEVRKGVFDRGNIPKAEILPLIQEKHPHVKDNNEADAVALAMYVKVLYRKFSSEEK